MQEIEQRDREMLNALQGEVPLASTPFALIGQAVDMSEKEVIKRIERLKREGQIRSICAQFDPRALGYRSCLVAARVAPDKVDAAAAVVNAHPGVTRNYRRNHDLNLWFTLFVSPQSSLGLERTIEILSREAECDDVRPLPTLRLYKSSSESESGGQEDHLTEAHPLSTAELECVRQLQNDLPLQPRPFDVLGRACGVSGDDLLASARALHKRGQMRRFSALIPQRKSGFVASAMGLWVVPDEQAESAAATISRHKAVSHCYLRPVYDDWPYNLYATVHARSVDECESIINDLSTDTGLRQKQSLFPTKEFKRSRLSFFSPDATEWESTRAGLQAAAV